MKLIGDFDGSVLLLIEGSIARGAYKDALDLIKQYRAYLRGQESMSSALSECTNFKNKAVEIIQAAADKQMGFAEKLNEWEPLLKESYGDL